MSKETCVPVIKWAGGKRQLVPEIEKRLPNTYNTYFEPFLGGAALFLHLRPQKAVLNDFNSQLVNLYSQIKDAPTALISALQRYQKDYNNLPSIKDKDDYYYQMRTQFNTKIQSSILDSASAALFIFLNKAGFNGLYRVSSNGKFNVPSAHRKSLNLFEEENINNVSLALKNADILCGDFEVACKNVKEKDFVFFDSPYYGTFDTYQSGGFAEKDHRRLFELFKRLSERGTYCLLTNSNTDFIKELYHDYTIDIVDVKRMINADASNRVGQEVIITNY